MVPRVALMVLVSVFGAGCLGSTYDAFERTPQGIERTNVSHDAAGRHVEKSKVADPAFQRECERKLATEYGSAQAFLVCESLARQQAAGYGAGYPMPMLGSPIGLNNGYMAIAQQPVGPMAVAVPELAGLKRDVVDLGDDVYKHGKEICKLKKGCKKQPDKK